jgi:hypothetical protein
MGQIVAINRRGFNDEAKAGVEIFAAVFPLIWYVWWVINHNIEAIALERHLPIVSHNGGMKLRVQVQADDLPFASFPETAHVYRCVQNELRAFSWVELQQKFKKFGVRAGPN